MPERDAVADTLDAAPDAASTMLDAAPLVATDARASKVPTLAELGDAICPDYKKHRVVKKLHALLADLATDGATRAELTALCRFFARGPKPPGYRGALADEPDASRRLRLFLRAVEAFPRYGEVFVESIRATLEGAKALKALSQLGIPNPRGLWEETTDRLSRALLPTPLLADDLGEVLATLVRNPKDAAWLEELPRDLASQLGKLAVSAVAAFEPQVYDAIVILATTASALGLNDDIRARSTPCPVRESPFFRLSRLEPSPEMSACIVECKAVLPVVRANLESSGVSIDVVYRLDVIEKSLDRIDLLLRCTVAGVSPDPFAAGVRLVGDLALARQNDRRVREVGKTHIRLLARKVIERAGVVGEHYITQTRGEWFKMFASAGGGGLLTSVTTCAKYLIKWGHFAPFVDGLLCSFNYAGSFLLMQLFGFTLATKQPSMTAAALADSIKTSEDRKAPRVAREEAHAKKYDFDELVSMIAAISRSQLAAIAGNILLVVPGAIAIDIVYRNATGHPFLDAETATHTLESFHPTHSGTLFYAALTGVLLWASSLGAGWFENWIVYRQIPQGLAERRLFGKRIATWFAGVVSRNASGVGGNVSIGFLLGMTPSLGKFFGLPIDIRHVTLSSGAVALSVMSLGPSALRTPELLAAVLGVVAIGFLNVVVSMFLALAVALDAREVGWKTRFRLLGGVLRRMVRSPLEFVFPPAGGKPSH